jgi:crossover junction endodeoxyribonuclease RuvC
MRIVGIDPGLDGAIALIDTERFKLAVLDMPTKEIRVGKSNKRKVEAITLWHHLQQLMPIDKVYMEKVGAMPDQGVTSMFNFGYSAGMLEGVVAALGVPYEYLTPQEWQAHAKVAGGKDGSREKAMRLFPCDAELFIRKKDNGRSDATCLAYAGCKDMKLL